jgi:hypothetical protein
VDLVLEVDDVVAERDLVVAAGWPLEQDLQDRPWGLTDFRVVDPAGYYLSAFAQVLSQNGLSGFAVPVAEPESLPEASWVPAWFPVHGFA